MNAWEAAARPQAEIAEIKGPPLRVSVIGAGYWGPNIVRNLHSLPSVDLVSVCDVDPQALAKIRARFPDVRTTTSVDEVLGDSEIEAVAIVTPVSTHFDLAAAALEAGKHVFVEKPLAESAEQAEVLIEKATRANVTLMPGHTFVYSPPVTHIKGLIDSGSLGEIFFISMSRLNLGLHQPDVSVVWDLGPHDISILRYWLDDVPVQVSAVSRGCVAPATPDVAFVNLQFASGTIANVEVAWLAPTKLRRTVIVGSQKMVVYDDTSSESVRVYDSGINLPDPVSFGEFQLSYRTGDIVVPTLAAVEPLYLELADFAEAARRGQPPRADARFGADVVRVIEAVDASLQAGGRPVATKGAGSMPLIPRGAVAGA